MTIVNANPEVARPEYGHDLLPTLPAKLLSRAAVFTQPEPWEMLAERFPSGARMHLVTSMEHGHVRAVADEFAGASAVFGAGGGSALDTAKFAAGRLGLPLVLVPTILSVDAAFTRATGVREGSRVRYVGDVLPEHLLIDFTLLQRAPPDLNRAGCMDVASIFTALWDWREAGQRGEAYEPEIAAQSAALLERLYAGATEIGAVTEAGLRLLSELFVGEVRLCEMVGNSRPEEGSEHYLAYCIERITKRPYIHGQLVGMCIDLVGRLQGQETAPIRQFLKDLELDCRLETIGVSRDELRAALRHMPDYLAEETQLLPGVFHFRGALPANEIEALVAETA